MDKRYAAAELIPSEKIPEEACLFFRDSPEEVCPLDGRLYLLIEGDALSCEDNEEGRKILSALQRKFRSPAGADPDDFWYQAIHETDAGRIRALAKKHGIEFGKKRTVLLFRVRNAPGQSVERIFREIAPLEEGDHLTAADRDTLALIKESALRDEDEIAEYTAAVMDTMASEGNTDLQAGIGREAADLGALHESFVEALNALKTGIRYHPEETLFRFSRLKVERIMDAIPADRQEALTREYRLGNGEAKPDEEMMETVDVFFANDLNIAAASKALFIHRNTLNYRLDKLRRETGLDVRNFQDAVVFRLIFGMAEKTR